MSDLDRRALMTTAAAGAVWLASSPLRALAQNTVDAALAPPPELTRFSGQNVLAYARELAKKPYAAPAADLPAPFASLTYDQYVGIRARPGTAVWADANLPFQIEPLHRGAGAFASSRTGRRGRSSMIKAPSTSASWR